MRIIDNTIKNLYGIEKNKKVIIDKLLDGLDDITSVKTLVDELRKNLEFSFRKSAILRTFIRCNLPYEIETFELDGLLFGLFVNREYQPLGFCCYGMISYSNTKVILTKGFLCKKKRDFYFYNDGNAPYLSKRDLKNYLERLSVFISEIEAEQLEIRKNIGDNFKSK